MSAIFENKNIVCGVSGSIAAYKVCDWVRDLKKSGADVQVVMTKAATKFVSPLTFAALSGNRVHGHLFALEDQEKIPHISLARSADLILVAPATAQTIARLASGLADDLLSAVVLASSARVVVCPAMNSGMYLHAATQDNIRRIRGFGCQVLEPDSGLMACGEEGPGRLPEWAQVKDVVLQALSPRDLAGKTVLVTAGPTEEPLDPVRFIGNRSSGKMGYAMAAAARQRGAQVILVSGPTNLAAPAGVECIRVRTAEEMYGEVLGRFDAADIIVKAAAVSDFRPATVSPTKIKKAAAGLDLMLTPNRDILKKLGEIKDQRPRPPLLIGFAAESDNLLEHGRAKLRAKNLDYIVVNDITAADSGFAVDTNRVTLIDRRGGMREFPLLSKEETARMIWDAVLRGDEKSEDGSRESA
ncbi:MAG: bifunctional phosphopantothenoylcysteine decarboxylase/phosphopantothenate--cysteine ligase CoaBC [Thermodesulfobacteriota bacterium]